MSGRVHYMSFQQVHRDVKAGVFSNEAELRQAFVEALKAELRRQPCYQYIVENMLVPALDETLRKGRPDIRVSNMVIEVERPGSGLGQGRQQLKRYMRELYEEVRGRVEVYGILVSSPPFMVGEV